MRERTASGVSRRARPRLAPGVQLLGPYRGSGLSDPPYLLQCPDGRVIQITRLLHLVAAAMDGTRTVPEIARRVTAEFGRGVSADNVAYLIAMKLAPLGILPGPAAPRPPAPAPVLGLRLRTHFVPAGAVRAAAGVLRPLFRPVVVAAVLSALALVDIWLFLDHGAGAGLRHALSQPTVFLLIFALLGVSAGFHELGHATACHYGGATPGRIGAGLYLAWPAFFSDVTDSYRLSRSGRLRTDLGGVYFNAVFIVVVAGVYLLTRFEPLLLFIAAQHVQMAYQFLPFVRLDGYYVVSDLAGVPDLFARVKPLLASLVPGRGTPPEIRELSPRSRRLITAWVVVTVPVLIVNLLWLVLRVPDLVHDIGASLLVQTRSFVSSLRIGDAAASALAAVNALILVVPVFGLTFTLLVVVDRLLRALIHRRPTASVGPTDPPPLLVAEAGTRGAPSRAGSAVAPPIRTAAAVRLAGCPRFIRTDPVPRRPLPGTTGLTVSLHRPRPGGLEAEHGCEHRV